MKSISAVTLLAVCWTASTSAQLDFLSLKSAPMADLMMTGSELNPRVEQIPPQTPVQKMTFDPSTLNKYQGPFAPQFYINRHNHFQQQQQQENLYRHSDIPISIPITSTNSIDQSNQFQIKSQQPRKPFSGVQTIQNRLLTLQELMSTPLFSEYMKIPLFRQFVSTPKFQAYLSSPLFQQYWTSPLFKSFFSDSAHFFKNIYPLLSVQPEPEPEQPQFHFQLQAPQPQEQQQQQQFQPQYFDNNGFNNYNDDLYTQASTPFIYQQGQGQEQERGQYGGQGQFDLDPEFHFQEQRRLRRRNEMPLLLWNLISAARQQKQEEQQQQEFQTDPQVVMQPPSSLTFEPSAFPFGQDQDRAEFQPEGSQPQFQFQNQNQPQIAMQAQTENQPQIVMMVVTEEDKPETVSESQPEKKKLPQLERMLLERIMRALFLRKIEQAQKLQEEQEAQNLAANLAGVPVPAEQKVTFVNGDKDNVELKDLTVEKLEEMPTILVRGEPIALNTNTETNTETKPETEVKPQTEMVDIPQEPAQPPTQTTADLTLDTEMEMTEEEKLKKMKKMKLMKLLKANKRFIKMSKDKDTKDISYSPASEITFTTSSPIPLPAGEMMTGAEEKIINRFPLPAGEMMTGAEEKTINKMPIPNANPEMMTGAEERTINNIPIPSPAVDAVPVPFTSFDIRPRRQSYSYSPIPVQRQNQNQERMTAIPINSPQFLQIVQMLRNQQQQEQKQEQEPVVYRLNSFEGQNQFLGSSSPSQSQPSKFHYTIADQVAPVVNSQNENTRYETTGVNGLHSVPLTRGQPIYQNGYPQRYAMPINNNYETYSIA